MNLENEILNNFLSECWNRKIKNSPSYSRNAMARDLDVSPAFVSNIFKGNKFVSGSLFNKFCQVLELDIQEKEKLKILILKAQKPEDAKLFFKHRDVKENNLRTFIDTDKGEILVDKWYYIPILEFFSTPNSLDKSSFLASQLEISNEEVLAAFSQFQKLDLIKNIKDNLWVKSNSHQYVPVGKTRSFIRDFHTNMISRGLRELKKVGSDDYENRLITGYTFSLDEERLDELKGLIHKFLDETTKQYDKQSDVANVYQINLQLFPLIKEKKY